MKRKTLTTAVMAGLTGVAGMVSVANAVNVNPDGLGQVLLYPYYSARGENDTLISVVNTTSAGKAVKVRFVEALNSREVLDFNLYLSPFDVWTAAVTDLNRPTGGDLAPGIVTTDSSCTAPRIFDEAEGIGTQEFLDFAFAAEPVDTDPSQEGDEFEGTIDGGPQGIERAASGYIEIIEMGTLLEDDPATTDANEGAVLDAVTHGADGLPGDCAFINSLWVETGSGTTEGGGAVGTWSRENTGNDPLFGFNRTTGVDTGGLLGSGSIVNVPEGVMFGYNATAIDAFFAQGTTPSHTDPGDVLPNLNSGTNPDAITFNNGVLAQTDWSANPGTPLPINAALSLNTLMNEYTVEDGEEGDDFARTEWVLTFPTKRGHVDAAPGGGIIDPEATEAIPPFSSLWTVDSPSSCDQQDFAVWDREEAQPGVDQTDPQDQGAIPSPPPPPQPGEPEPLGFVLCREANVVRFANDGSLPAETEILKEPLRLNAEGETGLLSYTNFGLDPEFDSGWVRFDFSGFTSLPDAGGQEVIGLPVIGFGVTTFENGVLEGGVRANYGTTFQHRGTRQVQ